MYEDENGKHNVRQVRQPFFMVETMVIPLADF